MKFFRNCFLLYHCLTLGFEMSIHHPLSQHSTIDVVILLLCTGLTPPLLGGHCMAQSPREVSTIFVIDAGDVGQGWYPSGLYFSFLFLPRSDLLYPQGILLLSSHCICTIERWRNFESKCTVQYPDRSFRLHITCTAAGLADHLASTSVPPLPFRNY